ncbi:MATE family efflux transporter [Xanthovirga aplysinae]|uniref:MATE family efflux transporter n=1 Tax=Xanthovirga aplysinae TaxID=2529853 RepID=UPI0012BCAD2A|nr:MATE family efflux transporter [Xanthovirga aplysinae]MTI32042.1 MATE family efflux transporter [Xanthovirga aplysinae]
MSNETLLGKETIGKALLKLAFPALIGTLVTTLYDIVDSIFVGHAVGAQAIGGLTVVLPISTLIGTFGMATGIGGSSIISRQLGAGKYEKVKETFGNLLLVICIVSLVILTGGYLFEDAILNFFGARGAVEAYATDYYRIVLLGAPFLTFGMMANNVVRSEGYAKVAMYSLIFSALLNTGLDALFLLVFNWGVKGAALATMLSQVALTTYLLIFLGGKDSLMSLSLKYWKFQWAVVKETFAIGSSSFVRFGGLSIVATLINLSLLEYGSEIYLSIYGVIFRVINFTYAPIVGITQGFLPLVGFNYGAKNYDRISKSFRYSLTVILSLSLIFFIAVEGYTEYVFDLFSKDDELIRLGSPLLRIGACSLPIIGVFTLGTGYFQAIGKAGPAFFLTLSRQIIIMIPLILILPNYVGLEGIFMSFPLSDVGAFILTLSFLIPSMKKLKVEMKLVGTNKVV